MKIKDYKIKDYIKLNLIIFSKNNKCLFKQNILSTNISQYNFVLFMKII